MRTAVIINPVAGAGRSGRRWPELRDALRRGLGSFEELHTAGPGHGAELARRALEAGARRLIAVGGDGTWRELVEGFFSAPEATRAKAVLGCCPTGSGCDFARHLRLPPGGPRAISVLAEGRVRRLDAVRATLTADDGGSREVHFTNMAAFGLGGEVARAIQRWGKPAGGTLSYLLITLALLTRASAREYELILDDEPLPEKRLHAVILGNTSTMGGGMKIAPDADAQDGLFEVVTFADMGRLRMMLKLRKLYSGTHLKEEGIGLRRGKRLRARLSGDPEGAPSYLNIDGEACGRLPASFELLPAVLPVLAP